MGALAATSGAYRDRADPSFVVTAHELENAMVASKRCR